MCNVPDGLESADGANGKLRSAQSTTHGRGGPTGDPCPVAKLRYTPVSLRFLTAETSLCLPSSKGCTKGVGVEKKRW